ALLPVAAVLSLTLWICLTFLFPLGPAGSAVHLLLGLAGALFLCARGLRPGREILRLSFMSRVCLATVWLNRRRTGARLAMVSATALTLIWALHHYRGLLGPFLLALGVAYLIAPLVKRLE